MNVKNYRAVLKHIEAHRMSWDQTRWHCGSRHCFAGWAQLLSGNKQDADTAPEDAISFLEISDEQADYIFSFKRTFDELENFVDEYEANQGRV